MRESNQRKGKIALFVLLGVLTSICCCVIVLEGGWGYLYLRQRGRSLATAEVRATDAARATATEQARITATPPYLLSIDETFDNNYHSWDVGNFSGQWGAGNAQISDGKFVVNVTRSNGMAWRWWPRVRAANFRATLEGHLISGDRNNACYGLSFRDQEEDFYFFRVCENGYFALLLHTEDGWETLIDWTRSRAIQRSSPNLLQVEAQGSQIRLFINDQPVSEFEDEHLTKGYVGIVVDIGAYEMIPPRTNPITSLDADIVSGIDIGAIATYQFDNYRLYQSTR